MIRIPHSLQSLDAMASDFYKTIEPLFNLKYILKNYTQFIAIDFIPFFGQTFNYLEKNVRDIVISQPSKLEIFYVDIEKLIHSDALKVLNSGIKILNTNGNQYKKDGDKIKRVIKLIKMDISKIFNYDIDDSSFLKLKKGALAYDHAENLSMTTCPYCNLNYTFTIRKGIKCRPQFDHFLSKGKYPYLGLSFFNLVPSCAFCNSGALKGQKQFISSTHLHPFIEDIDDVFKFRTMIKSSDFVNNNKDFEVNFQEIPGSDKKKILRAKENIKVFGLNERYKYHKDIAGEAIKMSYMYNEGINSIYSSFNSGETKIFDSLNELKSLIKSSFLLKDNFHQRALSKLSKDISDEFGI